jgi:predicted Ser/Thr protein kinase
MRRHYRQEVTSRMSLTKEILQKVEQIRVWKPTYQPVIDNPTRFTLLGAGKQGAVFRIDEKRCVKIYFDKESPARELFALQLGNKAGICPKVYFWDDYYIVMEYLHTPSLQDYLRHHPLTEQLTRRITRLLDIFEEIGFNRFDHAARHIYVTPKDNLKVIDVVHVMKDETVWLAEKLISDMGKDAELFLELVKKNNPKWYERWTQDPGFEQLGEKIKRKT